MVSRLITCPHCQYSKEIERTKIPASVRKVKCPRCSESFPLTDSEVPNEQSQPETPVLATQPASEQPPTTADAVAEEYKTDPSEQPLPTTSPEVPAETRQISFVFNGTAKEYFGIWIVNTLLKIVTLGIYSPWAKVRKRNYFYGCTKLDGMNFDYLANPIALLKGWLIGAALFLLYTYGTNYSPMLSMGIALLFYLMLPWIIVRSKLFNNRYSAYRNIRFNFYPDYKDSYFAYLLLPILTPLTAGILAPYMIFRQKQFLVANSSFGKTSFTFHASSKDFYMLFLRGLGLVLLVGVVGAILFRFLIPIMASIYDMNTGAAPVFSFLIPLLFFFAYLLVILYFYVRITNLAWNSSRLGKHNFSSTLRVRDMAWIFTSNGLAIIASCGLLAPWATIRLTKYRLQNLVFNAEGNLEEFEAANKSEVSAAGEEIGDIFGMDIGL